MAFSMFLRGSGCRLLSQQLVRPKMTQMSARSVNLQAPIRSLVKETKTTTPIMNLVRSFRTTSVRMCEKPHDHAKLWVIEKATSGLMVVLIPIGLFMPNKFIDIALALLITAHSFWGLEAIAVDYVRASIFGPVIPKIAVGFVYLLSFATLGGLFYLITHDVGFANAIKQFWAVKARQA